VEEDGSGEVTKPGPEARVVKACRQYLAARGHLVTRLSTGSFSIGTGASKRHVRSGSVGWADLVGCDSNGRFLAVEAKSAKGVQSEFQRAFQEDVERRGGLYVLARSIKDLEDAGL
jgi:hypothetical protein